MIWLPRPAPPNSAAGRRSAVPKRACRALLVEVNGHRTSPGAKGSGVIPTPDSLYIALACPLIPTMLELSCSFAADADFGC